jgi:hypothetical protein
LFFSSICWFLLISSTLLFTVREFRFKSLLVSSVSVCVCE